MDAREIQRRQSTEGGRRARGAGRRAWAGARLTAAAVLVYLLARCAPPPPAVPPPTAATIIDITPAPTQDIDATATVYARALVPTPTPPGQYIVQAGDTLEGLAAEFGTTVEEIMAANNLTDPDTIQVGQALVIPSLVNPPTATAIAPVASPTPTLATP
jgi:LysM repeat protein